MEIEGRLEIKLAVQSGRSAKGDWAKQEFVEGVDALGQGLDGHEAEEAAARLHLMPQLLHVDGVIDAPVDLRGLFLHDRAQMDGEAQVDQENDEYKIFEVKKKTF